MSLLKEIEADFLDAMRNKDKVRKAALTAVKAQIKMLETAESRKSREPLTDEETLTAITKVNKSYQESISGFKDTIKAELKAGTTNPSRQDNIDALEAEMTFLKPYLPTLMTEKQIEKALGGIINDIPEADREKSSGKIMGAFNKAFPKKADNKIVQEVLKRLLAA